MIAKESRTNKSGVPDGDWSGTYVIQNRPPGIPGTAEADLYLEAGSQDLVKHYLASVASKVGPR